MTYRAYIGTGIPDTRYFLGTGEIKVSKETIRRGQIIFVMGHTLGAHTQQNEIYFAPFAMHTVPIAMPPASEEQARQGVLAFIGFAANRQGFTVGDQLE